MVLLPSQHLSILHALKEFDNDTKSNEGADRNEGSSDAIEDQSQNSPAREKLAESQTSFQVFLTKLKPIRRRYTSSFTMHALDHIINGTTLEKVFWITKLFVVISTAIFMCRQLFVSYFMNHVDTNILFKTKTEMNLPAIIICGSNMEDLMGAQYDCTSKSSKSYNAPVCESLQKKCPRFCKDKEDDIDCKSDLVKQNVTCDARLLGQCIVLNSDGKMKQTLITPRIPLKHKIRSGDFPLWVYVKHQEHIELMPTLGIQLKWTKINQLGDYHFVIEHSSIKRLPYPYNKKKPCMEKGSTAVKGHNMFNGKYTAEKCLGTCMTRAQLKYCGSAHSITSLQVLDQEVLKQQLQNKTKEEIQYCVDKYHVSIQNYVEECSLECPTPCQQQQFLTTVRYDRNEYLEKNQYVEMFFYYLEMTEKRIEEAPSYVFSTLFANFGGTLGLMTGISAISVIEMTIWFSMFLIDRCYRLKN